jgi:predicted NBD/HSP70 family sugar kinase
MISGDAMKPRNRKARTRHRRTILSRLHPGRSRTRGDIARETGLSPATVSRITRDLVKRRLLREIQKSRAAVGRPTQSLEINGEYGRVLGVSLLCPVARALVLDLRGEILREETREVGWQKGRAGLLDTLKDLVCSGVRRGAGRKARFVAVGLAIPGQWDRERGVSIQYPRVADWKDVPVRDLLEEWTGRPAFLVGYAPALALAEHTRHAKDDPRGLLAVEVEDTIAMGVIFNGDLLEGASGNAGELGHITIDPEGPVCYCGNNGCLETLATCQAVVEGARRLEGGRGPASYEGVVRMAGQGDAFAQKLLHRTATTLGIGLASAVNLLNPDVVVLNGRFFDPGEPVMGPLKAALFSRALQNTVRRITIERSTLGPRAAALGAGIGAIRGVLQSL